MWFGVVQCRRVWLAVVGCGWMWVGVGGCGRVWLGVAVCVCVVECGWVWLGVVGCGRVWLKVGGCLCVCVWSNVVECGWVWLCVVGCGWVWLGVKRAAKRHRNAHRIVHKCTQNRARWGVHEVCIARACAGAFLVTFLDPFWAPNPVFLRSERRARETCHSKRTGSA